MQSIYLRLFIAFFLLPAMGYAQITMPTSRIVFQRGNDNRASVPIQGNCPNSANSIQVKANALNGGSSQDWTTVGTTADGVFMGNITLSGGWYSIQVRALANGSEVGQYSVDKVGVGEVFAIAGQSNVVGSPYANNLSATDDRVSTLNYGAYFDTDIHEGELPTSFVPASNNSWIGPKNAQLFWGELGDKLVARLGVPVMFLGAAYGGTSSKNWRDAAVDGTYEMDTQGGHITKNAPYRALGIVMSYYAKRTGMRSIIWHQGESDPNTSQGEYVSNITQLINKTRSQSGLGRLSWMVCRATYLQGVTNPQVIAAQNQLADPNNNCFAGPATDFMSGTKEWRFDDGHINDSNYPIFEGLFNDIMTVDYFQNSQPSQPAYTPSITTGYILPHDVNGGSHIQVPYMATAPVRGDNQYTAQLLDENGTFLADLGAGSPAANNLIDVQLPVWADGRVRVNSTAPARNGEASEFFVVHKTGERSSGNPVLNGAYAALNMVSGTPVNVTLPANFSDLANLALAYSWQNLPAGLSGSGLTIQGTVSGSARTETATLTAINSGGNSVSTTVFINIANPAVTPVTPVNPAPATNACGFTEGQFLFTFYGERVYAHLYNGILFAANESATSGFKPQIWVHDAGSGLGFDMSKVGCFATTDPRLGAPVVVTPTPTPVAPTPVTPTPTPITPSVPAQSVISPRGYVDISECGRQYGWARDAAVANKVVSVLVYWDNVLVSTLPADQYRNDLATAFGDNGNHGFHYDTPVSLQSAGNHQVKIQIEGAASAFHSATVYCVNRSRVVAGEVSEGSWLVFPNPVTDLITLKVPPAFQSAALVLSLASAGGKPVSVIERPASVGQRSVDVSGLQTGVYVLRVGSGNQTVATLKILKQ